MPRPPQDPHTTDATATLNLGEFEQIVLIALLRLGPDAHGVVIHDEIEQRGGRAVSISALYTTLERLQTKGLVRARLGEPTPQRGGKRKKHYELLPPGVRALRRSYGALARMVEGLEAALKEA